MKTEEESIEKQHLHTELTLICACYNFEHQLIFWKDDEFRETIIYVNPHLAQKRLWKRIVYAIRYIFGYKSRFGAWDEFIMEKEHIEKLFQYLK